MAARIYDKVRFRIERSGMKTQTAYRAVDPGAGALAPLIPDGLRDAHSSFGYREITVWVEYRLHSYVRTAIGGGTAEWLPIRSEVYAVDADTCSRIVTAPALTASLSHVEQRIRQAEQVRDELAAAFPADAAPSDICSTCQRPIWLDVATDVWSHVYGSDGWRCTQRDRSGLGIHPARSVSPAE